MIKMYFFIFLLAVISLCAFSDSLHIDQSTLSLYPLSLYSIYQDTIISSISLLKDPDSAGREKKQGTTIVFIITGGLIGGVAGFFIGQALAPSQESSASYIDYGQICTGMYSMSGCIFGIILGGVSGWGIAVAVGG